MAIASMTTTLMAFAMKMILVSAPMTHAECATVREQCWIAAAHPFQSAIATAMGMQTMRSAYAEAHVQRMPMPMGFVTM